MSRLGRRAEKAASNPPAAIDTSPMALKIPTAVFPACRALQADPSLTALPGIAALVSLALAVPNQHQMLLCFAHTLLLIIL
jgi:hypothetical protein